MSTWFRPQTKDRNSASPEPSSRDKPAKPRRVSRAATEPHTLPAHFEFRGELSVRGPLLITSSFEGKLIGSDTITIAAGATVTADIEARHVRVHGSVEGTIRAEEGIEIAESAQVRGDVHAPRVMLADGCRFMGRINPGEEATPSAKPSPTTCPPQAVPTRVDDDAMEVVSIAV